MLLILISATQSNAQNNALAFDGTDDVATATGASNLIVGGTGLSLTLWVYPTNPSPAFPNFDGIAGFRNNIDADFYLLQLTPTSVEARFRNSSGVNYDIVSPVLTLNTWTHLAFTYDGSMLRLYKNEQIVDSLPASGSITNPSLDFLAGNLEYQGTNFYLQGRLDEISVWDRALSAEELVCLSRSGINTGTATGLKLYYPCNQGTASGANTGITSLNDAAGNINASLSNFSMNGTTSNFVAGAQAITTSTQFICPDSLLLFNGQLVTAPGVYFDTLSNAAGCDSIIQLNLYSLSVNTGVTQNGSTLTANHTGTYYQWVDCNNNFAPIPGANAKVFNATAVGSYAVIVLQGACYDTSSCYTVSSVGLNENEDRKLSVFPSITSGLVYIKVEGAPADYRLQLTDMNGRLVIERNIESVSDYTLNLSDIPAGFYQLDLRGRGTGGVYRILKQ